MFDLYEVGWYKIYRFLPTFDLYEVFSTHYSHTMSKTTIPYLRLMADRMLEVQTPKDLAAALRLKPAQLEKASEKTAYSVFHVPKRDGSPRLIEDPVPALKTLQRGLNELLQAVYYFERSEAAYGFVVNPADDPSPRHIVTHAERHIACRKLMNIDLDDFFHQIETAEVWEAVQQAPFRCNSETAELIAGLTTYKGRLPMGAPTSPVLSNLVFREEDTALTHRSRDRGWLYTRYADDLTFSSGSEAMTEADLPETIAFIEGTLGYVVHPDKRRYCAEGDTKSVTRLIVTGTDVKLPDDFYSELGDTLRDLSSARRVQNKMGNRHTPWLTEYNQRVEGMLAFAKHVLGERDEQFINLQEHYQQANAMNPSDFGAYTWLDFPYL